MYVRRGENQKTGPTHFVEDNQIRALCEVITRGSRAVKYVAANHCCRCKLAFRKSKGLVIK